MTDDAAPNVHPSPTDGRGRSVGVATALGSAASNQFGAAMGAFAFPVIGPLGVVAVRQVVAAAVLLAVARPPLRSFTWAQWWPVLLFAVVLATMNLTLYVSIERIGLGLAVALEFLGPLSIALVGTRSRAGALSAVMAGAGVLALTHPDASSDFLGIGLALVAACGWASYIVLNRTLGRRLPGVQGTAAASAASAVVFLPIGVAVVAATRPDASTVLFAVAAGVFASAVPFALDLLALKRLPAGLFGVLSSVQPVFAAAFGVVLLRETLVPVEWAGVLLIAGANVAALALKPQGPTLPEG
ncbi:MAG TPA: EamA family transporter [Rubricoccaceae bacterium]|jgi:inner membrane transporter RhtA